ncbi:ABC transporter ATP-binding protein [Oceanivirga salmonicida]|uniref:ABC transporter ATP-binding protein n=1 Tax=Oceanivirga salmonicida TaxID=1769291 RepID=UPI0009EC6592|nr:dipeptide/oligopeptide/nickel ABC transporter ATP-binding protein [Oceanivirga salmonicida]
MLLEIKNLSKKFNNEYIFENVSFNVKKGEIFSIIGKSGIGKSTIAKIIMGIEKKDGGEIIFENKDISERKIIDIQMIFQDPYTSLNEAITVENILKEPLIVNNIENIDEKVDDMLKILLLEDYKNKYPTDLSGGQRQRVVVGAAMISNPKLIICDEPLSALDLSTQEQIINLIKFFNKNFFTTFIFISHDINLVKHISDRVFTLDIKK